MWLSLVSLSSLSTGSELKCDTRFSPTTADRSIAVATRSSLVRHNNMKQPTAQQKHDILLHCESRREGESDVDVAARHGVVVSRRTIWNWRSRWDRTPQSLERHEGSGATPILTPAEISRHIRAPILAANRAHRAVSYTKLLPEVRRKTGKAIALRTLQQIGKEQLDAAGAHTRKRTADECECTHT